MRKLKTAQRRRPRIPSYLLYLLNQHTPRDTRPKGRAYRPARRVALDGKATDQDNRHILRCLGDRRQKSLAGSDQAKGTQFDKHPVGQRSSLRPIRRRVRRGQVSPTLERPAGPVESGHQLVIDLDQAIAPARFVSFATQPGYGLADPDLTADDPIDRSTRKHLLRPPRTVPGVNPASAAFGGPRLADLAQMVDAVDPDGELQQMDRHQHSLNRYRPAR